MDTNESNKATGANEPDWDGRARATICALEKAFGLGARGHCEIPGGVSIGLEIEVPWSSYFPQLWEKYGLSGRRVADLEAEELARLGADCSELEASLLPRLRKTIECGVPRGGDRYWEFSFEPAKDVGLLARQVEALGEAGLLPRDKAHSLHATVGGLAPNPSLYYLAMMLELEFVEPARMGSGIAQTKRAIHSGWARKGRAGIFRKGPEDLAGGERVGSELRMLQLPKSQASFERLLGWLSWGSGAIAGMRADASERWIWCESRAREELGRAGLADANWTRSDGEQSHAQWELFERSMPRLREKLDDVVCALDGESFASSEAR